MSVRRSALAYARRSRTIYAGAFFKRHAGFGTGGPNGVYVISRRREWFGFKYVYAFRERRPTRTIQLIIRAITATPVGTRSVKLRSAEWPFPRTKQALCNEPRKPHALRTQPEHRRDRSPRRRCRPIARAERQLRGRTIRGPLP